MLCDTAAVNLLGRELLSKLKGLIRFAFSRDFTLEFSKEPEPDLLCFLQSVLDIEEEEFCQKILNLIEVPKYLWATFNADTGRVKHAEPIKILIDLTLRIT